MNAPSSSHALRLSLIRPHLPRLGAALIMLLVSVAAMLCYPALIARFLDNILAPGTAKNEWAAWILPALAAAIICRAAAYMAQLYLFTSTGSLIVARLRKAVFNAIIDQEIGFFDTQHGGELTSRLSSDVEQLQGALTSNAAYLLQSALTGIGSIAFLVSLSPRLSLLLLVAVPPMAFAARWITHQARDKSRERQQELADCGHVAQEVVSNIRLVHAFTRKADEKARYAKAADKAQAISIYCNLLFSGFGAFGMLVFNLSLLLTVWVGQGMVTRGSLSVGDLTSFLLYAAMTTGAAAGISGFWTEWMRSLGATDRIFDLMHRTPPPVGTGKVTELRGDIRFEAISFAYPTRPERPALKNFSLTIAAGEKIALVGPSGAGKSTIVSLLLGFYPPTEGTLYFDGRDAATLDPLEWRRFIAVVEQEPALFSGSILDNILYALPQGQATPEMAIEAAKAANLHDFVVDLPKGYDTLVGDKGVQLSGGQKQRVAIARALLRDPAILILDEATSALDSENEEKIQEALQRLMEGRTSLIIAHRLSTIADADRIVVMQNGEIRQAGGHNALRAEQSGLYARLLKAQAENLLLA